LFGRPPGAFGYSFFHAASHLTISGAFAPGRYGISEKPMTPSADAFAAVTSPGSTMLLPTKNGCLSPSSFAWRIAIAASAGLPKNATTSGFAFCTSTSCGVKSLSPMLNSTRTAGAIWNQFFSLSVVASPSLRGYSSRPLMIAIRFAL
jgi:hypothetical protein